MDKASVIFDVVARYRPSAALIRYARERGKTVITGSEVFARAVEQFVALYRDSPG